jgi:lysophospholipid acyltransferase (LPLAT)-like uncharacterized protein
VRPGWQVRLASDSARVLLSALMRSCRFQELNVAPVMARVDAGQPVIFSLWHGRLLPLTWHFRDRRYVPMISRSGDGEYISRIASSWGYEPVRGSSSRGGGEALHAMLQAAEAGRCLVFTPDGPRGPFQQLKPGVLRAAQLTGLPIVPASAAARHASYFGRWDRFLVPHPGTRIVVAFGDPITVPQDSDAAGLEAKRAEVTEAMNALTRAADALVARR